MTDTTTPALIQADPTTVVIDGNVRVVNTDSPDFTDLVESIKTHGVLTPCRGYRDDDGTIHITEGQRRTLAATQAKTNLPVYLAADADAAEADRILAQLAENDHRATIAASDRVTAYEQLSLLGVSPAQIAKRTRRNRAEVDAALTVAHNPTAREHLHTHELTLDQAATLAEFSDDAEATQVLERTLAEDPVMLAHQAQRIRDQRAAEAAEAQAHADLINQGLTPLTDYDYNRDADITSLTRPDDEQRTPLSIDDEDVRTCDGLRFRVHATRQHTDDDPNAYTYVADVSYTITDYRRHGFISRWSATTGTSSGPMTEEQKAERRTVIENNRAWDSAETVRRDWLRDFATRKTAPKGAAQFLARMIPRAIPALDKEIHTKKAALTCDLLGVPEQTSDGWHTRRHDLDAYLSKPHSPGRATHLTLMTLLISIEANTGRHNWRNPDALTSDYLQALAAWGYTLSPIEQTATDVTDHQ